MKSPVPPLLFGLGGGVALGAGLAARWGGDLVGFAVHPNTAVLVAGLGGTAMGGAISYVIARQTAKEALARDLAERLAKEEAAGLRAVVTAGAIERRFKAIGKPIADAIAKCRELGKDPETENLWGFINRGAFGARSNLAFNPDDLFAVVTEEGDVFGEALDLEAALTATETKIELFCRLQDQIDGILSRNGQLAENAWQGSLIRDDQFAFDYRSKLMSGLLTELLVACHDGMKNARSIATKMAGAVKERVGTSGKYHFRPRLQPAEKGESEASTT